MFSAQVIISELKNCYGLNILNLTPLYLGADADAAVYKAEGSNPAFYLVKIKHGEQNINITLQALLNQAGIQEILLPLQTGEGRYSCSINN